MGKVTDNYNTAVQKKAYACQISGRDASKVKLLAVIKYASDEQVLDLFNTCTVEHAGESRLQDALIRWSKPEFEKFRSKIKLHFLGQLQKNKIAKITALFDYIDSVDSVEKAAFISAKAAEQSKTQNIFIQLKLTSSLTQGGVSMAEAADMAREIKTLSNINLCGLMAIAPQTENAEDLRPVFKEVKVLFDNIFADEKDSFLSLGMSSDFEVAVQEGSTLPRIGSMLFEGDFVK